MPYLVMDYFSKGLLFDYNIYLIYSNYIWTIFYNFEVFIKNIITEYVYKRK
jgi:hypothetical protein